MGITPAPSPESPLAKIRRIGLSLGADLCWPACFEEIVRRLDLDLPAGEDSVRFEVERVTVEPYDLRYKPKYDVVLDRITHWFFTTREWVKKIAIMDGVYVLNNPWMIQAAEKHTTYCAMMRLGFPIPETWLIPPKEYADEGDTLVTIRRYNQLFSLPAVGAAVGWPAFLKPYDGGAWRGVSHVKDAAGLARAYDDSGRQVMHLQKAVSPWDLFVRAIGVGPQVNCVKYDPDQPLHARYVVEKDFLQPEERRTMERYCKVINAFFLWDYNSCEALRQDGVFHPIDFANACPDSQVTSLHYHFPWTVKALVAWTLFCAWSGRKPNLHANWEAFFAIADQELPFEEKLSRYEALADRFFDAERFAEFRAKELGALDEVAWDFFGTAQCKDIVRAKVATLYPKHEIEPFTDRFFEQIQGWRADNSR